MAMCMRPNNAGKTGYKFIAQTGLDGAPEQRDSHERAARLLGPF
jgi:hypothetical protein